MKIVEPQVELWEQEPTLKGAWNQIARATRVCYQSKPREGESSEDFVKRIILKPALVEGSLDDLEHCKFDFDKMHGAMLEHGTIYLTLKPNDAHTLAFKILMTLVDNPYSRLHIDTTNGLHYITTNMRVILENNIVYALHYMDTPTNKHDKRYTFSVITDIGVTREMNRHRKFSVAEQSTRYCSYNANKFGSEITYITSDWINNICKNTNTYDNLFFRNMCKTIANGDVSNWDSNAYYYFGLMASEFAYMGMKHKGNTNDKCREVLNLNTKTQAVYTAFVDDWNHFLRLRADGISGKPHPNMKIIADKIKELFNNK